MLLNGAKRAGEAESWKGLENFAKSLKLQTCNHCATI